VDFDSFVLKGAPYQQSILHIHTDLSAVGLKEGFVLTVHAAAEPGAAPAVAAPLASSRPAPGGPAPGGITLGSLGAALAAAKNPKSAEEVERERGMHDMQSRLAGSAKHVLTYEDRSIQAQVASPLPWSRQLVINLFRHNSHHSCLGEKAPTLEAAQGTIDGFFSHLPYTCHHNRVGSVGD